MISYVGDPGYNLRREAELREFTEISEFLSNGDRADFEFVADVVDAFPHGGDARYGDPWIFQAVWNGSLAALDWMIEQGVPLNVRADDGYILLQASIDCRRADRHARIGLLINAGIDLDLRGTNGWTALHMAAMRDDETAMALLLKAGADRRIRTDIDGYETAEETALRAGHTASAAFIADFR